MFDLKSQFDVDADVAKPPGGKHLCHQEIQHKHVVVRAEINNPPKNCKITEEWFSDLISDLKMEVMMGPFVVYHEQIGNRGLTGIAVITTSSLTMHCWDEPDPAVMQFDVYTCGNMDLKIIWKALQVYEPILITYKYLDRANGLVELESGDLIYSKNFTNCL